MSKMTDPSHFMVHRLRKRHHLTCFANSNLDLMAEPELDAGSDRLCLAQAAVGGHALLRHNKLNQNPSSDIVVAYLHSSPVSGIPATSHCLGMSLVATSQYYRLLLFVHQASELTLFVVQCVELTAVFEYLFIHITPQAYLQS